MECREFLEIHRFMFATWRHVYLLLQDSSDEFRSQINPFLSLRTYMTRNMPGQLHPPESRESVRYNHYMFRPELWRCHRYDPMTSTVGSVRSVGRKRRRRGVARDITHVVFIPRLAVGGAEKGNAGHVCGT